MKTLYLPIKKKWFDMILSGEKKEEYREIKSYWTKRLLESDGVFDTVELRNGYGKNVPSLRIELKGIVIDTGFVGWGAERGKNYYVLMLGELLEGNGE